MTNIPLNKKLYNKIKSKVKRKFRVWPSAYASGFLVREYKKMGGTYTKSKVKSRRKSKTKSRRKSESGLSRWFSEEWIDVCKLPDIVKCGRKNTYNSKRKYPYCRPRYKISDNSPRTASSLSKKEIRSRCKSKRKSPYKKVTKLRRNR